MTKKRKRIVDTMKYLLIPLLGIVVFACKPNRLKVDVSDIEADVKIFRVDSLLYAGTSEEAIENITSFYPYHQAFIDIYTQQILKLGEAGTDEFNQNLRLFLNDSVYAKVGAETQKVFANIGDLKKQFESGFKHLRYYFPDSELPDIYMYASGFNHSLVVGDNFIGVALDKYLGSDCIFYKYLGIHQYIINAMYPQKMIPDAFYAWVATEYPNTSETEHLLSNMIYEGKLTYFVEAMLPQMPDSVIMGYSAKKIEWCEKHEAAMWTYLVERKLLYSSDKLEIRKYLDNAPFTQPFTDESPGRTGVWLGWQIVRSYMNKHPELSLAELMETNDAQLLLSQSGYFPE